MSIVVTDLLKIYGEQKAVDRISFTVNKGEIVGFLGPNGAGKSTTMKMITGYLKPNEGSVTVAGINVAENPLLAKSKIGYLPEANPLYYEMYVKEYLDFIGGIHKVQDRRKTVQAVIELTGLTVESKKKINQLSKGYKQRVGLAASLIHDPEVLILDEPTSGLDPNQIIEIRNVIRQQGQNKTVLFSSHILQEVEAICDRVIIINKGQLVANDTLANLKKREAGNMVRVSFKEALVQADFVTVTAATSISKTDEHTWQLEAPNANDVKRQLLELSLLKNVNIVSLQTESGSLEDIFRSLTMAK